MNRWSRGTVVATLVGLAWQSGVEGQEKGDSVLNEAGIPIKVITTRDCKLYEDADGSSKGAPCPVFKYWYVLPPEPN
ncbi:MAG: hypothetical protein HY721_31100, partial [Planctomycetes bacterium]|nr:hypothetical protein [Planctomycetota bacterium]